MARGIPASHEPPGRLQLHTAKELCQFPSGASSMWPEDASALPHVPSPGSVSQVRGSSLPSLTGGLWAPGQLGGKWAEGTEAKSFRRQSQTRCGCLLPHPCLSGTRRHQERVLPWGWGIVRTYLLSQTRGLLTGVYWVGESHSSSTFPVKGGNFRFQACCLVAPRGLPLLPGATPLRNRQRSSV